MEPQRSCRLWDIAEQNAASASGHFFTVTGIMRDKIRDDFFLRVSNNGEEQYISYNEYVDFVLSHVAEQNIPNYGNGIIYIEEL